MMAGCGTPVQVQKVRGTDDTAQFLRSLGFVEGGDVTVVCDNGGNLIVDVKGARVAVARQMAAKIMVKGRN
ncbi:ferrous iron transport protein A [Ruminococcaceae bacterium OttesenSCG-928-A11]|nr:ferrous iron transport protein A [Ruminococcaceae bacterium OttesenSCG-928-A11]